jgi:predicted nuclease of predicted toxin-antitoxin system
MLWLLDQGLPRSAIAMLGELGYDVLHVGDLGMASAADVDILEFARDEGRIVVTLDADFHAILACSGAANPSVIRIREEGLKAASLVACITSLAAQFAEPLERGCVMSVEQQVVRFRYLPIA